MNIIDLIIEDKEQVNLDDVFLQDNAKIQLQQLIKEHQYIEQLTQYGLPVNNKIFLHGSSGCGKTITAKAIANTLNKKLMILNLSNIVNSRIGETSKNIKQIFDKAGREGAVLFLDEFDQIGKAIGNDDKDVGEMRRLVNTIIQLIDYFPQKALLIAATNHSEIIDTALQRRFQIHIEYKKPSQNTLDTYYNRILEKFPKDIQNINRKYNISFAEAKDHCFTQIKANLIEKLENEKQ